VSTSAETWHIGVALWLAWCGVWQLAWHGGGMVWRWHGVAVKRVCNGRNGVTGGHQWHLQGLHGNGNGSGEVWQ
jgi:hypothetical protein